MASARWSWLSSARSRQACRMAMRISGVSAVLKGISRPPLRCGVVEHKSNDDPGSETLPCDRGDEAPGLCRVQLPHVHAVLARDQTAQDRAVGQPLDTTVLDDCPDHLLLDLHALDHLAPQFLGLLLR